jgi:ABC-type uncharacterized transport system substrate-binding protein
LEPAVGTKWLELLKELAPQVRRIAVIFNPETNLALIAELVRDNIDLLVTSGAQIHPAAKQATTKIPIVMVNATDPVGEGLVASLA